MKKRFKTFAPLCVFLLAAYAAVDLFSENFLYKTTHKPAVRLTDSTYTRVKIPFLKKDGTQCYAILITKNVLGTGIYEIKDKHLACVEFTNDPIPNGCRGCENYPDAIELGRDDTWKNIGMPGIP